MDLDKNRFLATNLGIQSIPTFLFIHNGQVVKKMSGADQATLTTNIKWMVNTYQLSSGVAAPQPAPVKKTLQVYTENSAPFYFETEKWDLPIKKLKEYALKHHYFEKPAYHDLEKNLVIAFGNVDEAGKKLVVDYCLEAMPLEEIDDLVPFVDFIRICFLKPELTE